MTRPDTSSVVRTVAKFCENPGMPHWKAVSDGGDGNGWTVMRVFIDSDHASHVSGHKAIYRYFWAVALSAGFWRLR